MNKLGHIIPNWPAPTNVNALTTTRHHGHSVGPYASNNLDTRVGDDPKHVALNRQQLHSQANLPSAPNWLDQVHGTNVVHLPTAWETLPEADASITDQPNTVCVILTADCLPILLTDLAGQQVAAIHAGWRGLYHGVIEQTIGHLQAPPQHLIAWIGPGISQHHYEVDHQILQAFASKHTHFRNHFVPSPSGQWLADLAGIAETILQNQGIINITPSGIGTYSDPRFYSFRRDQGITGRMATLIYFMPN